jgi:hypothetical protein
VGPIPPLVCSAIPDTVNHTLRRMKIARKTQDRDVVGNESNDACASRGADRAQPECSSSSPAVRHARPIRRRRREQGSGGEARVHSHPRTSVSLVVDPRSQVTYGAQWRESARQERDARRPPRLRTCNLFLPFFIYLIINPSSYLRSGQRSCLPVNMHVRRLMVHLCVRSNLILLSLMPCTPICLQFQRFLYKASSPSY